MALVALDGTPLIALGAAQRHQGVPFLSGLTNVTCDALNESFAYIGRIFTEDGASHTIDTTGSSSLGWMVGGVTFANVGSTFKVGLAAVDAAAGPPARAAHVANVITFDVSKTLTGGGGGIPTASWQEHVPDAGTKTIANGDLVAFCGQMTAFGGADVVRAASAADLFNVRDPSITLYTGTYANVTSLPNAVITFSDGKRGWFWGGFVAQTGTTDTAFNSGSATKERGNYMSFPFPVRAYGMIAQIVATADFDMVLYSDPLGTPVAQKTISVDSNTVGSAVSGVFYEMFPAPYDIAANTPIAAIIKPGASNVTVSHMSTNLAAHMKAHQGGENVYGVNRASGAFAAQNSNKDRYSIGLLVGAFDAGGGGRAIQINNPSLVG